jgi:hypothetical protein
MSSVGGVLVLATLGSMTDLAKGIHGLETAKK